MIIHNCAQFCKHHKNLIAICAIVFLGVLAYGNALFGQFVWDDEFMITNNVSIRSWSMLGRVFSEGTETGAGMQSIFYRPVLMLTLMFDYSLWKLNVIGYHFTTIALHIGVSLALYFFINLLLGNKSIALLTSLLFVVHPVQVEDVAYITGRADSLGFLFMLISFILYIKNEKIHNIKSTIFSVIFYVFALFSKENIIIFPALLFLYLYTFRKKINWKFFTILIFITIGYLQLRLIILKSFLPNLPIVTTPIQRLAGFFVAIAQYIRLIIFPCDLHMGYGQKTFLFNHPQAIIGIFIVCFLVLTASLKKNSNRLVFFSIFWFFIALLPVSNIFFPASSFMAERYLYVPSIGLFLLFASFVVSCMNIIKVRTIIIIMTVGLLFYYSFLTIRQNTYWKEPIAFYERTISYEPDSADLYNNLGNIYLKNGDRYKAAVLYLKAIEKNPNFSNAYYNLGVLYREIDFKQALYWFKKSLELNPGDANAYNNIGAIYGSLNDKKNALSFFEKATKVNPYASTAFFNLGIAYEQGGEIGRAIDCYLRAVKINPFYSAVYNNLGAILGKNGKTQEAITLFRKAIEVDSNNSDAYYNLGYLYLQIGNKQDAKQLYHKAITINPHFVGAYEDLALTYLSEGNSQEAINLYKKALMINPDDAKIHNNLAALYYQMMQFELAKKHCQKALSLGYLVNHELLKKLEIPAKESQKN